MGFILKTGEIVEVENVCHDKENGFEVSGEDLMKYEDTAVATWHTHPGEDYTSNLTVADMTTYLSYPQLAHYIVGRDGVTCYVVQGGKVVIAP